MRVNGDLNNSAPSVKGFRNNPSLVRINGLGGDDFITANGVFGTATTMHLRRQRRRRQRHRSRAACSPATRSSARPATTPSATKQGQRGDISNGGPGKDQATIDAPGDSAFDVETINGSIGVPSLKHTALKGGQSTVER